MHIHDKALFGTVLVIVLAMVSWAMATSVINSSRIAVIEDRLDAHVRIMEEMRVTLQSHRTLTEPQHRP